MAKTKTNTPKAAKAAKKSNKSNAPKAAKVEAPAAEEKVLKTVVPNLYKERYGKAGNCGDEVATALLYLKGKDGTDAKAMAALAKQNGVDTSAWTHLNIGQQRMNLGNVLRGRAKRGEEVRIGEQVWNEGGQPQTVKTKKPKAA